MRGPDRSLWGVMTGTSMASPTVAGIIAQWLQINPSLSPGDIKAVIAATAIKDNFTVSPHFGPNGKIDALAGARYLLGISDEHLVGDVNNDGEVTIKDVTILIDYLLTQDLSGLNEEFLDVNQDGLVSIKDVTALIDMLLSNDN
jgi:subtilisin family serine protease